MQSISGSGVNDPSGAGRRGPPPRPPPPPPPPPCPPHRQPLRRGVPAAQALPYVAAQLARNFVDVYRLGYVGVHAAREATLDVLRKCVRRHRNNRQV